MSRPDPSPEVCESRERWLAIVPTLGRSEHLARSVAALRRAGGRVMVVAPRDASLQLERAPDPGLTADPGVEVVATDGELGFAAANLAGLGAAPAADFVALVNDDAIVGDGWAAALLAELDAYPQCAATQGVVLTMDEATMDGLRTDRPGATVDGAGLAWNGWWQAVQIGHGEPAERLPAESVEVFGVSATAAMYRRSALDAVGPLFDVALGSYYEDVDLALRLRAAGWTARLVPAARARHAGSTTGRHAGAARLVRRNRYSVLARALGASLLPRLPKIVLRDVIDAFRALVGSRPSRAATIAAGTVAGLGRLPWALRRRGLSSPAGLRRWMPDPGEAP